MGSDAALRMGNGLQTELGDKQRDGNGRAPLQELFHSCFLQFGETELTSKIPSGTYHRAGKTCVSNPHDGSSATVALASVIVLRVDSTDRWSRIDGSHAIVR